MNTKELLNIADQAVYESTGRHLTDLQSDLLKASCENQTYEQFANEHGYCLDYIKKDVGSVLWNLLSHALKEKITKKNFRQALERYQQAQENLNYQEKEKRQGFSDIPDTSALLGRTEKFGKLRQWIVQNKCAFVAFIGFSEIDKTSLVAKLVEQMEDEFDNAIARLQPSTQPLTSPLGELVPFLPKQQQPKTQTFNVYQNVDLPWLRWWDAQENLLPTPEERAEVERQKRQKIVEKLRSLSCEQLQALGIDPEMLD